MVLNLCNRFTREEELIVFSLPAELDCIESASPPLRRKIETKNPQTHPGSITAERMGAGLNQLTIGPNPNSRLNFISGISRYLPHILCTFLFLSLEGESRKVDSFGRGFSAERKLALLHRFDSARPFNKVDLKSPNPPGSIITEGRGRGRTK